MKTLLHWFVIPVLFLTACGESFVEVAARHQPGLDALQADMKKLSELVAANPGEMALASPLDPAPVFKQNEMATSHTALLIHERLADPNKTFADKELLDLFLSNGLENFFIWSAWDDKVFEGFETDLQATLALRYLVAYKTLDLKEPLVDAKLNYTIGGARLGVYVYDREKDALVCSFPVAALSSETVEYQYRQDGSDQVSAANSWAHSSLWENLRKAILPALAEKTGGTFEL
jgi:hypothetical protein